MTKRLTLPVGLIGLPGYYRVLRRIGCDDDVRNLVRTFPIATRGEHMSISVSSSDPGVWAGQAVEDGERSEQSQQGKQTQPAQQSRHTPQSQPAEKPKSIPTLTQVKHAQSANAPATRSATHAAKPEGISPAEAKQLIERHENGQGYPNDSANAKALATVQANGLRGTSDDHIKFETRQALTRQKIEALPQQDRDRFSGMQAKGINAYESATTDADRQKAGEAVAKNVDAAVDAAYGKHIADPAQRVQQEFNTPYGSAYLGAAGEHQSASLDELRTRFNDAKTPQERESVFAQAAGIRHQMQQQIENRIGQAGKKIDQEWAAADKELYAALSNAKSLHGANSGEFDNATPFNRLTTFSKQAFTSERNAQEFQYLMQQHPDSFKDVKSWYDDASAKTEWARSTIQSDPLRRTANLPAALPDFLNAKTDDLHRGNYGAELLDRYKDMNQGVGADAEMYHAASQRGPIKDRYLDTHTPPKPLWQQQTEDVVGRFIIGLIPGVNLLADVIVPAKSLSPDVRTGIDIMSGVLGGMADLKISPPRIKPAEANGEKPRVSLPKEGEVRGAAKGAEGGESGHLGGGKIGGVEGKGSASGGTHEGGTGAGTADRMLPQSYASKPKGVLLPDHDNPGMQIDEAGEHYISDGKNTYAVRYDRDNKTWRVYPPENPTKPGIPVAKNREGVFEPHDEVGLKGGGPPRLPPAVREKIFGLLRDGWTFSAISREVGVAVNTVKSYFREKPPAEYSNVLATTTRREDVFNRLGRGETETQIATEMGIQPETVRVLRENRQAAHAASSHATGAQGGPSATTQHAGTPEQSGPQPGPSGGGEAGPVEPSGSRKLDTKDKVRGLLRDGWSNAEVVKELHVSNWTVASAKQELAGVGYNWSLLTKSKRDAILARLDAGATEAQVGKDLNVQVETVRRIRQAQPSTAIGRAGVSGEPQPGTSTGGETGPTSQPETSSGPPAKRQRVEETQFPYHPWVKEQIIKQIGDGTSTAQIAQNLHLPEREVQQIRDEYLLRELAVYTAQIHARHGIQHAATAADVQRAVIHQMETGASDEAIAHDMHLTVEQVRLIRAQYHKDALPDFDFPPF
ncbi:hypothetical protein [Paraburkholderia sp.]|uniref:hypothetical protein n=1 Tax=Paraburkholderia sp. TaxID=1926495 RepID=UPI00238B998B|nr:hypothetical protein [Paraburkholderia sp.]MDE1184520.1 hypothetical protein [Paraburkholderia sp.]